MNLLSDLSIGILADHGVSHAALTIPREKMEKAGAKVLVISPRKDEVKAWNENDWGIRIKVDLNIDNARSSELDALLIPGGPFHSDSLRNHKKITDLIRECFSAGKIIGAIGHGIQLLISTETIRGRQVTASSSLKTDIGFAQGIWTPRDVVSDNGLVTCRSEDDIENFNKVFLEELRHGVYQRTETII
jgi:protease I